MELTDVEAKVAIAKLIEVAYSTDKGMTTKIVMDKGTFKLTLDEDGNAELTGKAGPVRFVGGPELRKMGLNVGAMSIMFTGDESGDVRFFGSVGPKGKVGLTVSGKVNIVELITTCSGLLCQAARLLKGASNPALDIEYRRHMGY
jgi:hypothetical protein